MSIDLTTQNRKGKSKKSGKNYPLKKDPLDIGQRNYIPQESYMRRQGVVDYKNNYYATSRGSMEEKDFERAKVYGERAKQKYLSNKKK